MVTVNKTLRVHIHRQIHLDTHPDTLIWRTNITISIKNVLHINALLLLYVLVATPNHIMFRDIMIVE